MIGSCTFMLCVANPKKLNDSLHCSALICFICCLENRCALQRTKLTANNTIQVSASCEKKSLFSKFIFEQKMDSSYLGKFVSYLSISFSVPFLKDSLPIFALYIVKSKTQTFLTLYLGALLSLKVLVPMLFWFEKWK